MRLVVRLTVWLVAHTIFKVKLVGRENVPSQGPALLVSNHVTYADGFLISYCVNPEVRFMAWTPFFRMVGVNWVMRMIKAIPVGLGGPRETSGAILRARNELLAGQIVCIFPEGSMTRTGYLLPFKRGMEKIAEGLDVPIVPIYLGGLWGSIFSFEGGRFFWKWPRRVPYPVTISFGKPMAASSSAGEVRQAILRLAAESGADCMLDDEDRLAGSAKGR
jgi:acyl-[acyl-carrier-protein]-phospholipid O-acyltransferase/long-chain-fatty-acid--[acyl-carrier-protein] ligase